MQEQEGSYYSQLCKLHSPAVQHLAFSFTMTKLYQRSLFARLRTLVVRATCEYGKLATILCSTQQASGKHVRVRFQIIRNERIYNVGKYQSCVVSKLRIIWKQTVLEQGGATPGKG